MTDKTDALVKRMRFNADVLDNSGTKSAIAATMREAAEALAEQPAGAVCPDCAAAVLYECPACSATNYPDRPDAIGSGIGELRRVLRMVFDAYRDNEARLPPLVAGCVEGALINSDATTPQPDGGDGAVACVVNGYLPRQRAVEVKLDFDVPEWITKNPGVRAYLSSTRPSAAAAVPEGFVLVPMWKLRRAADIVNRDGDEHGVGADIEAMLAAAPTAPAAPNGGVVVLTLGQRAVAAELLRCCESWEPGVRIMGNVKASDAADLLRSLLPAPKLDDLATPRAEQGGQEVGA